MADAVSMLGLGVDSSGVVTATNALNTMADAGTKAATATTQMEQSMTGAVVKGNLLADAIQSTAQFAVDLTKQIFDLAVGLGKYQDLAEQIQADPAGLASLQVAADTAGVSVESIGLAMNRLTKTLASTTDESKGAGKALAAIGLSIDEFKSKDPAEQYRAVAQALEGYADGAGKVAIAQEFFGRGGAQQLRAMKELASETERNTLVTNDMIATADEFADSNARSASQMRQVAAVIGTGMIPGLSVLRDVTKTAVSELFGIGKASDAISASKGVEEFAQNAVMALGYVVDAVDGVIRVFRIVGTAIGGVAAAAVAAASGEFTEAKNILGDIGTTIDAIANEKLFSQKLKEKFADNAATKVLAAQEGRGFTPEAKQAISFNPKPEKKAKEPKQEKDDAAELIASLRKKAEAESMELELGRKLTDAEKLRLDTMEKINKSKQYFSTAERGEIELMLTRIAMTEEDIAQRNKQRKAMEDYNKEQVQVIAAERQRKDVLEGLVASAEEELSNYGKTTDQLRELEIAKLRDAAATLRQRAMMEEFNPDSAAYVRLLEDQAVALERVAKAREEGARKEKADKGSGLVGAKRAVTAYLDDVADVARGTEQIVGNALQGTEDQLTALFTGKRTDIKGFIDSMIAEFTRLSIVKPLLADIMKGFGGGGSTGGSVFGDILGGIGGMFGFGGAGMSTNNTGGSLPTAGGAAAGGATDPFTMREVNERGPELLNVGGKDMLMMGSKGGNITPNSALGGKSTTFAPVTNISIDSRTDSAQVQKMIRDAQEQNNKSMMEQLKAQGVM